MPAIKPMMSDEPTLTNAQGAVMATSPARQPFKVIPKSVFPNKTHDATVALNIAAAAAVLVVMQICDIAFGSAAIVEPGLNPNQPSHRTNVPIVARLRLCPGIGFIEPSSLYFPNLGPSIITPANAAQPPIECTTVEPAKSQDR